MLMKNTEIGGINSLETLGEELSLLLHRQDHLYCICYSITSLSQVNFAYGRRAGDNLINMVAAWVEDTVMCKVFRVSGDIFCIIADNATAEEIKNTVRYLYDRFDHPWAININAKDLPIYSSIDISIIRLDKNNFEQNIPDLCQRSLDEMRKTHQITVFDAEKDRLSREHMQMQLQLQSCILQHMYSFDVYYQPIVDASTGIWQGLEALCRWTHPELGPIAPKIFIHDAEEMGLIHLLGRWVLETAIRHCKEMALDEMESFFICVNVSSDELLKYNFDQQVLDILRQYDFPGDKLVMEITESTQFTFNDVSKGAVTSLREHGVRFSLDDFGTGYSAFNNLKHLPVDFLKTEGAFVEDIENDAYLQYFLYVLAETAHLNKMNLIAEGVENKEQLKFVINNGADFIQGYLFSEPMCYQDLQKKRAYFHTVDETVQNISSSWHDLYQWLSSNQAYQITPTAFNLLYKAMELALEEDNFDLLLEKLLELIGQHLKLRRVFLFFKEKDNLFCNSHQWCAEGNAYHKKDFEKIDLSSNAVEKLLLKSGMIIAKNSKEIPAAVKEILAALNLQSIIQAIVILPLIYKGELIGFIGCNDIQEREWLPEAILLLQNIGLFSTVILSRTTSQ